MGVLMKQSYIFFGVTVITLFLQPVVHGATVPLSAEEKALVQKTVQSQTVIQRLQSLLKSNTDCLVHGTCKPGQRELIVSVTKQVAIAVVSLAAIAATAAVASQMAKKEEQPLVISSPQSDRVTKVELIAQKYGETVPRDNSTPAQFIISIKSRLVGKVDELASLVKDTMLKIGKELVAQEKSLTKQEKCMTRCQLSLREHYNGIIQITGYLFMRQLPAF